MARHDLAARSLRHLRFAHRMMVGQPLLARASHISHPPTSIVLDGYQMPIGRILRRLPLHDVMWAADGAEGEMDAAPAADIAPPSDTLLRLLPRLPETHDADITSTTTEDDAGAPPATTSRLEPTQTRHIADDAPPASTRPLAVPPARAEGVRPRSRIVELPGTVSLPVEESSAEEPGAPDIREESPEDVPEIARAESLADAPETTGDQPAQPPLLRDADERRTTSSPESAQMATRDALPVPP
ncbi:MAG TPA: hypothetical protein VFW76_14740, partial [Ktedonobacterales bacterium]|nr:hypothetical protein [Ktedonobacterales bacterium]